MKPPAVVEGTPLAEIRAALKSAASTGDVSALLIGYLVLQGEADIAAMRTMTFGEMRKRLEARGSRRELPRPRASRGTRRKGIMGQT